MTWKLDEHKCMYCAACVSVCPTLSSTLNETKLVIDEPTCTLCSLCERICPVQAITVARGEAGDERYNYKGARPTGAQHAFKK
jgi:ferredoxin